MKRWVIVLAACAGLAGGYFAWEKGMAKEARTEAIFKLGVRNVPFASTRGHFDNGNLIAPHHAYDYEIIGNLPKADDILVVVHGLNNTEIKAENRFALAEESLRHAGYQGAIVGYSWDGSTNWDPWGATGYRHAKHNAMANGKALAKFLIDLQASNPKAKIRVLGYSMGARMAAEAVRALDKDPAFASSPMKIASVHLVGAAIDDEHLQTDSLYGTAIEHRVGRFYNYFSPKDSKLGKYFPVLELDRAVGRHDLEDPSKAPSNYTPRDVSAELKSVDQNGSVDPSGELGTNHSAYLGIRNDKGAWQDDGAMNVVAADIAAPVH